MVAIIEDTHSESRKLLLEKLKFTFEAQLGTSPNPFVFSFTKARLASVPGLAGLSRAEKTNKTETFWGLGVGALAGAEPRHPAVVLPWPPNLWGVSPVLCCPQGQRKELRRGPPPRVRP